MCYRSLFRLGYVRAEICMYVYVPAMCVFTNIPNTKIRLQIEIWDEMTNPRLQCLSSWKYGWRRRISLFFLCTKQTDVSSYYYLWFLLNLLYPALLLQCSVPILLWSCIPNPIVFVKVFHAKTLTVCTFPPKNEFLIDSSSGSQLKVPRYELKKNKNFKFFSPEVLMK